MIAAARLPAAVAACTLTLLLLARCQRNEAPRPEPTPAVADAARGVASPPPVPPPPPPPSPPDDTPDAAAPASKGAWLDGNIYRFRVEQIRPCPSTLSGGARVAAVVRVDSKIDELLVAPRDFKLDAGGVILDSAIVQKAPAACGALLTPKSLRAGKSADGAVVFDLPPGFNADHQPVRLAYQPTRWGGARRVAAVLPPESLPRSD